MISIFSLFLSSIWYHTLPKKPPPSSGSPAQGLTFPLSTFSSGISVRSWIKSITILGRNYCYHLVGSANGDSIGLPGHMWSVIVDDLICNEVLVHVVIFTINVINAYTIHTFKRVIQSFLVNRNERNSNGMTKRNISPHHNGRNRETLQIFKGNSKILIPTQTQHCAEDAALRSTRSNNKLIIVLQRYAVLSLNALVELII